MLKDLYGAIDANKEPFFLRLLVLNVHQKYLRFVYNLQLMSHINTKIHAQNKLPIGHSKILKGCLLNEII